MLRMSLAVFSLRALAALAAAVPAIAQCATTWGSGHALPGVDGPVFATTEWDLDGPGPAPALVVVAGPFTVAGSVLATGIAAFDPVVDTWQSLGSVDGVVDALAVLPNGHLVAAGSFAAIGGTPAANIARWNGLAWSPLGSGTDAAIEALAVGSNGDVFAAGWFATAGAVPANGVARWNGTTWSALGSGLGPDVRALAVLANGDVVAGGAFNTAGAPPRLARWNGVQWQALGLGVNGGVWALAVAANGDLFAAGDFTQAGGAPAMRVAKWNGAVWAAVGSGADNTVQALALLPNGDLIAGGSFFFVSGTYMPRIARWDGAAWSAPANAVDSSVRTLAVLAVGGFVAGGEFSRAGETFCHHVVRWDGAGWRTLGAGTDALVARLHAMPNGDVWAGGEFRQIAGVPVHGIARWDGSAWSAPSPGLVFASSFTSTANGDPVAAGWTNPTQPSSAIIARWSGTSWQQLGGAPNGFVAAMARLPNGDLVAAGQFTAIGTSAVQYIARWDGTAWLPMGTGLNHFVTALAVHGNGDLVAGGTFFQGVARWDGTSWLPMGSGFVGQGSSNVLALAINGSGTVFAGGTMSLSGSTHVGNVARWDGAAWQPLGAGLVHAAGQGQVDALTALPNGDVVATGLFDLSGGAVAQYIARWNGVAWAPIGAGLGDWGHTLAWSARGELHVGGGFTRAGGAPAAFAARLLTTCPAAVAAAGAGCSGSGGANVLAATALPWTGATFRSIATGMPANGIALAVTGFAPAAVPLAAILPQGLPGCSLLATPDLLDAAVPIGGSIAPALAIPNATALAGTVLHLQVAALELGATGAIVALTSTNALVLTIGAY